MSNDTHQHIQHNKQLQVILILLVQLIRGGVYHFNYYATTSIYWVQGAESSPSNVLLFKSP